ncbi:MAG: CCA tRNA nucleotidyltransferase [Chloroflexi bacterium]|nr:CCA tRNA nucleotidyltransferase [Chloroflexota bacterium]
MMSKAKVAIGLEGEGPHNLAAELETRLPAVQVAFLKAMAAEAEGLGRGFYLVGGVVRDLLLGRASHNFDLVLEGDARKLARALGKRYGGEVTEHKAFRTAVWTIDSVRETLAEALGAELETASLPASVDLISARKESYAEAGALPDVELDGIEEDTRRRDFTVNTLALRLDGARYGELVDLHGGVKDLATGRLRVLHDKSFEDDATRILRILRFAGRLGFEVAEETKVLLADGPPYLRTISGERIRHELEAALREKQRVGILAEMERLGVLRAIQAGLVFEDAAKAALAAWDGAAPGESWEARDQSAEAVGLAIWLTQLDSRDVEAAAKRLRLDGDLRKAVLGGSKMLGKMDALKVAKTSEAVIALDKLPALARYALFAGSGDQQVRKLLKRYEAEWRQVQPTVDGHELKRLGLTPGPRYSEILGRLRAAWLDGEVESAAQETDLLRELLDGSA